MKPPCLYNDIDIWKEMSIYLVLQPPLSFSIPSQYNRDNKHSETSRISDDLANVLEYNTRIHFAGTKYSLEGK
jgi:hypothetical protein